ncbi:MAG: phosphodiester glycosidase family protein, partial [Candidatus Paceibacterales bacterium]
MEGTNNSTIKSHRKKAYLKWFKRALLALVTLILAVAIFIKADAPAAAYLADHVLRPLIGDRAVIFFEDVFFSILDTTDSLVYKFKQPEAPQFLDQDGDNNIASTLNLTAIPVSNNFNSLKNEGVWHDLASTIFPGKEVMATTFVRPDPNRSFAIVSLVQIDTKLLGLDAVAGTKEPGGTLGNPGSGVIPQNVLDSNTLVAGFNGGFLYSDGKYGMIVGDKTYVPLETGAGTIAAYTDGSVKIFNYTGDNLGKNLIFARQNSQLIVENGQVTLTPESSVKMRGRVLHGGIFTWRSGIGITKTGNLLYAAGNNLSPMTLAIALQMAGAENAIPLDINPSQVHFY